MKKYLAWLPIASILAFSCSENQEQADTTPLSSQELKFEIYDSLVVDLLGNLILMDISPSGEKYLLLEQTSGDIILTDQDGNISHQYNRTGDGPENYPGSRIGLGQFISEESYFIPTMLGFYEYNLSGELLRKYEPNFTTGATLLISNSRNHIFHEGKIYSNLGDRAADEGLSGLELQQNTNKVEVINLTDSTYQPSVPIPAQSRFSSSEELFPDIAHYSHLAIRDDSLYLMFRNEPVLYSYPISDLTSPSSVRNIPFDPFVLVETEDPEDRSSFRIRDLFTGTINFFIPMGDDQFLIEYLSGLEDDQANEIINNSESDFGKMFEEAIKINQGGLTIFDGKNLSPFIEKEEILGSLNKFVSKDEIWFALNFEEVENDYSVLYKTRLVAK